MKARSVGVCRRKQGRRTAPLVDQLKQKVTITHPFHPNHSKQYNLLTYKRSWGHESVDLQDDQGRIITVPIGWTDAAEPDPFVVISEGRSHFRVEDLVRLVHLIEDLKG